MGVSRSGYYKWKKRDKSKRDIKREELIALVESVHANHRSHGYRWTAAYIRLEYGYECTQQLLDENPDLDAVIASVDVQGLGAIRALSERGMRVPEQVRVMSLTGHEVGGMLETSMTSMEMPAHEMGAKAARMIINEIETPEGKKHAAQHLSFAVSLAEREST